MVDSSEPDLGRTATGAGIDGGGPAKTARAYAPPSDRFRRVLLVALALALAIVGAGLAMRPEGGAFALVALGVLAAIGLAALFATAMGILGLAPDTAGEVRALVTDSLDTGIAVADETGRVVYANAAYAGFVGQNTRTPEGALADVADAAEPLYRLCEAARSGRPHVEDIRLVKADAAEPRWLRFSAAPAVGQSGRYTVWRVADISGEASRQEDTFHELQQIINYLDHAPAGFFSLGSQGRVAYVNATLASWLGLSLDRTTGGALRVDDIAAPDAVAALCDIKPVRSGAKVERIDIDLTKADGSRLPVHVIHRVTFDAKKRMLFSRSLVLERHAMPADADSIRAVETRFLGFFGTAPIGIAMIDAGGAINRCNPAFTRLFGIGNLKGKSIVDLVDENGRAKLVPVLQQGRLGKATAEPIEISFGRDRVGQIYFSVLDYSPARAGGLLVYAIDRTEQRQLESQISQGAKMQAVGQLAGGVAHDFNNLLTAIIGFSDLLLANHRPTDPSFQDIMNIRQNANRAAALVRQLLAFSRQQTLLPEVVQITDVITDISALLNRLLGEKIELDVSHNRDLWPVHTDVNQFEQVIVNLVVNARDAMAGGGCVKIRTTNVSAEELTGRSGDEQNDTDLQKSVMPAADFVEISVSDTGIGMEKDIMEKVFNPFFTTKEIGKGTGLGLSTVYGIVKQTRGFIFVESEPGKGTTFSVYLPRHIGTLVEETGPAPAVVPIGNRLQIGAVETGSAAPVAAAKKPEKRPPPSDLTGTGTILLVEDEDAVRTFSCRALESKGYTMLAAASGEEALEIAEENEGTIDLVISDVIMPEMDGPTLVKELQKRYSALKIIFISGYAEAEFRKSVADNEDFDFLPKPFSLKQLAEIVKMKMES
ncbi:Sensory box histidine kinase/response regulator [hydrothermal vent metagenome]|uniref:Sensory box histidine kinase/response regulator n=1 Tax=hydrothermal vent metagenome TaxID=652676 RepID=A0A3B0SZ67_9ZZZZ